MKNLGLFLTLCLMTLGVQAQVVKVNQGEVTFWHEASLVGDMTFAGGTQLTVEGKAYDLSGVGSIEIADGHMADNTVAVVWSGSTAHVDVSGNLAAHVTVTAVGADVSVVADATVTDEIVYVLSGTSPDGSFYMDGEAKATVNLNNLTLTNTDGGAITIDDGKKITVNLIGTNTLTDGPGDQRACLFINGHVDLGGTGSLTITGNSRHGYFSDEYTEMTGGTLTILGAPGDGMHVNQYFRLTDGTVTVTAQGDGLDIGKKNKITEGANGMLFVDGGRLTVTSTGTGYKGIKTDSTVTITGGTVSATVTGPAVYDATAADITSPAALKPGGTLTISGGTVTLSATGAGGKGINADGDINVSGGTLDVATYGALFETGGDDTKPQGIKSDGNIILSGGTIHSIVASDDARAFSTDYQFLINGGTVMGIGGKKSEPTGGSQGYKTYKNVNVAAGQTVSYDGVSYTVPSTFSHSGAKVLVSTAGM